VRASRERALAPEEKRDYACAQNRSRGVVFCYDKMLAGQNDFQVAEVAEIMVQTMFHYRESGAYLLHEFVIMPDHIHALLTPSYYTSLEKAVQFIKGGSSHRISKARGKKMEIWQVGFYHWTIRDAEDWLAKVRYIHMNPVRAGLVAEAHEWSYSSARGGFKLDAMPGKFRNVDAGAKAQVTVVSTQGLKPLPPKEKNKEQAAPRQGKAPSLGEESQCAEGSKEQPS
jgi:putative transposase